VPLFRDGDSLLHDCGERPEQRALLAWAEEVGLESPPDWHRLVLERWLWDHRERLDGKRVLDVGVDFRRDYFGPGYVTFGQYDEDVTGDLHELPFATGSLDAVCMTEVLEHVERPQRAVDEVRRALKPGGVLLVTSPFVWPWHGIPGVYRDFWRFTHEGWAYLLRDFAKVAITRVPWTNEGATFWDMVRRFEGMGWKRDVDAATGYLAEAIA